MIGYMLRAKLLKVCAIAGIAVAALGWTATASEQNVIRRQIEPCWHIPAETRDAENLVIYIAVMMNPDGTVRRAEFVDRPRMARDPIFRAVAASALRAVLDPQCSPLELPPQKYQQWKKFILSFNPKELP